MNKSSSIKQNLALQTIYQVLNVCIPLITTPYLSRVLGAERLGVFSSTSANVSYFSLFAMLGILNYGTRTIAANKQDWHKKAELFGEIFYIQILSSTLAIILYVVYFFSIVTSNKVIVLIQGIEIISAFFNIS